MLTKTIVTAAINEMPETFTLDEIMQRMYLLHKIEKARQKSKQGKTFTTTEAKKKLQKWLNN